LTDRKGQIISPNVHHLETAFFLIHTDLNFPVSVGISEHFLFFFFFFSFSHHVTSVDKRNQRQILCLLRISRDLLNKISNWKGKKKGKKQKGGKKGERQPQNNYTCERIATVISPNSPSDVSELWD
jgi:hypothetical protein